MTPIMLTITGTTPLLCGRPAPDVVDSPYEPRAQAASRLYLSSDGRPVIPGLNCFRCLLSAAVHIGRSTSDLVHAIGIAERDVPIHSPAAWTIDTRYVRHPKTGERRLCHRPRFNDWYLRLSLLVDVELLAVDDARRLVEHAGQCVGLGDYRPERNGPFGRFQLTEWLP